MAHLVPFNRPYMTGKELVNIAEAHLNGKLSGDGPFTKKCHTLIEGMTGSYKALLTHSCTASLEMCAILLDISQGDEIILPSYTFVSTANAFLLRGAKLVFVDVRSDTLNIDERKIEQAITEKTKAVVPVHYAGVSCDMEYILRLSKEKNIAVIEDAAQGFMSTFDGKPLGSIGDLGAYSFHETKNVISGEGGCLLINNKKFIDRAEIIREKGTDRSRFIQGLVDKYTWKDLGSSYLPGEMVAAFLFAQLEEAKSITSKRMEIWDLYHKAFIDLENKGVIKRPSIPENCTHNAHMYYLLFDSKEIRDQALEYLNASGVNAVFHYIPLHSSPAGRKYGRANDNMENTNSISSRILRLPLWVDMSKEKQCFVIDKVHNFFIQGKF